MKDFDKFLKDNMVHINKYCTYQSFKFNINYNDLKSNVLEKIWKFQDKYTEQNSVKSWINIIARHCAINYIRSPHARQTFLAINGTNGELQSFPEPSNEPNNFELRQYAVAVYKKIRREYPGDKYYKQRMCIYMCGQGYRIREIAEHLNISENNVKSIIFRVREYLHDGETIII